MNYLDGKNNLKTTMLKKIATSDSAEIILSYTDNKGTEVIESYPKTEIFSKTFCSNVYDNTVDDTVITLAADDVVLEFLRVDIPWWMKRPNKLEEILNGSKKPVKTKTVKEQTVVDKYIAVGTYSSQTNRVYDIRALQVVSNKQKEALDWLNEHIKKYQLAKKYDALRICLNYIREGDNEWYSVDELLEKGLASI